MSIFGSLYSSVSGIEAQSTAISIIADNIANVNTVGYKAGSAYFDTLVTNSGAGTAYSSGGVRAQNKARVNQQGLVQSTSSPLDIAISGNGFFVVQNARTSANNPTISYTRAGSFHADSLGYFVNPAGLYLKAWPLDINGNIPNASASLSSLETVNIGSASGNAKATTTVSVGINLNAAEKIFLGAGATGKPGADGTNLQNQAILGKSIMIPNANLEAGDSLRATVNASTAYTFTYGGFEASGPVASGTPVLGATNANDPFSSAAQGDTFTITRSGDSSNPLTFKYVTSSPNTAIGEFSNLATLATAINQASGMTARVNTSAGASTLYVSAQDAREGLTFAQGSGATVNFPTALGLANVAAASGGVNRWNSMEGLANLVNTQTSNNVTATMIATNSNTASIQINNSEPLTVIQFTNVDDGSGIASNFLAEMGLTTGVIQPTYDGSSSSLTSMASGNVTPAFQRNVTIYDSLGQAHQVNVGFIKTSNNNWRAEIYTLDANDTANGGTQIASGKITFNTDGSLASIDSSLTDGIPALTWSNGATSDALSFDFGTAGQIGTGKTDGLRQFSGAYNVDFLTQNGSSAGLLDSVSIDPDGFIIANFSNGQTQKLYKIPLADFSNPNGLIAKNGNSYIQSFESGEVNLKESGSSGAGTISPGSLEGSNTELSTELTSMIVAQRAYQASAKVITTASQLLEDLNRISN